ncbi:hypothetical protein COY90_05360 [Candidatus Roizmanbacteria bacterium CG_4_10_14_0_8_um_filter_39_9]|uniref:ABC transporter permease n=1 Tax=Candidatus Roizmanbacteria bacterium CG_4_10_14_0_8_um_filter_39_9 TaxID=1974829 RepID=A0A2M7QCG1_9BACT|nr:MAG: hypothetical protein COY90_05360 [Candidatus Roizmanbacteria bacterium CG_4_10_14_0_8_um_filter_39_9]
MRSYIQIIKTTVREYAAYRFNFLLWRFRMLLNTALIFFLWFSIYEGRSLFGSVNKAEMLSYILFSSFLSAFVMGTRTPEIASDINNGSIINMLLRPISFFGFYFAKDLGDKLVNVSFSFVEILFLAYAFHAPLLVPQPSLLFFYFLICGVIISFYINMLLSFIGFWTTEVWAPRFLFTMLVFFVSGTYFPLNLLPTTIYQLLLLTPFPYLYFIPTNLFIHKPDNFLVPQMVGALVWTVALHFIARFVWRTGNKNFSFWGR